MKKILGLDLGTNSIGWAVIDAEQNENEVKLTNIESDGSRIIPMDAAILGDFDKGNSISQTAKRTGFRGTRRLRERCLLRRERLHRILNLLGFLPEHYSAQLDKFGKIQTETEPKLPWRKNEFGGMEFIFQNSFNEMLSDFAKNQPPLVADSKKVPYDWTIYYLRKKALEKAITKEELAWILLNFNQKRGYYQLRGEDEEKSTKSPKTRQYFDKQIIADIIDTGKEYKGLKILLVELLNGDKGKIFKKEIPEWKALEKNIIVTVDIDKDGNDKYDEDGLLSRRFKIPTEQEWDSEWKLIKIKTENDLEKSKKTVGCYIYDTLLQNPNQKIIGKLVRTVERKFYKSELKSILDKQKEFIPELQDKGLFNACLNELYPNNEAHRKSIVSRDFTYLFLDDILFYQRPLKSKKSLISNCPYEEHVFIDRKTGEKKIAPIKCIPQSHPLFQEFRLCQFVANTRIYQKEKEINGKLETDVNVTADFLKNEDDYVALFEWLNDRKEIDQKAFLKYPSFGLKKNVEDYRWNYVEDKSYPCNETRALILSRLSKSNIPADFLTRENEESLWRILYSVEDKYEIVKALKSFAVKHSLNDDFVEIFQKFPPFKKDYGSYSAKAIKKLLPLMRMGKYWSEEAIDANTKMRIDKLITGEYDEKIKNRVREKAINLSDISHFKALPLWLACYIVYNRHSEAKEIYKWETPADIDKYLKNFKQHSLRNPIVEQVITETLRTVRDIWKQVGQIDEIHVELGREMKNPADKRAKMAQQISDNENNNLRIKALLAEFINPDLNIENVRPYSPSQQDILRIYEEYALENLTDNDPEYDFISKISKTSQPTKSEIIRYKLWLEQRYRSPYTGEIITLGRLFTSDYEIEHVIPQSRYFDDSFSNKVICESEVNKLKTNQLGYEFIKNHHGEKVQLSQGKTVEILSVEAYEKLVKDNYSRLRGKMKKLLMEDIPDEFIKRQLNDSRYISKVVKTLLSNIVREKDEKGEYEQEAVSKNLISCTGGITDRLKKDWGMNDVWNSIVLPRFERMNELTGTDKFTSKNQEGHTIPNMPLELQKGFNKKRIDHRHHAMDAIVIACATRNIVNYLNNESASKKSKISRYDLQVLLCDKVKTDDKGNYKWVIKKPWNTFTQDTHKSLDNIIVSFKQNLRVINKTTNHYQHFDEKGKKVLIKQTKGDSWAIRKPLHKDTVFAKVNLRKIKEVKFSVAIENPQRIVEKDLKDKIVELLKKGDNLKSITKYFTDNKDAWADINLNKIKVYYFTDETNDKFFATRKYLDTSFDRKKIEESITDTGIQKILIRHLGKKDNNPELAFSPDGIDEMNRNLKELNNGKNHQPILKVRVYKKADKFAIGTTENKTEKYVGAAKGTNLYFAVYVSNIEDTKIGEIKQIRSYATVPLNIIVDCQKQAGKDWRAKLDEVLKEKELVAKNSQLLFLLSPNDLVYLPTAEQLKNGISYIEEGRIYKMVDASDTTANFVPHSVSNLIYALPKLLAEKFCINGNVVQNEFGIGSPQSKNQRAITGEMIKETCIPIKVDRLGNIVELNGKKL